MPIIGKEDWIISRWRSAILLKSQMVIYEMQMSPKPKVTFQTSTILATTLGSTTQMTSPHLKLIRNASIPVNLMIIPIKKHTNAKVRYGMQIFGPLDRLLNGLIRLMAQFTSKNKTISTQTDIMYCSICMHLTLTEAIELIHRLLILLIAISSTFLICRLWYKLRQTITFKWEINMM